MPKVSIIVPVYKVEKYLPKCVESILNQTYGDFELLLVDDGSPDNCGKLCDDYAERDARIRSIHQENQGQGGARNNGISIASGKYVFFVDSDDYVHPRLLEKTVAAAEAGDCDVVMFNAVAVDEKDNPGANYRFALPSNTLLQGEALKPLATISGVWNRLWKRQLFVEHSVRFPLRVWYEDLCFPVELAPYFERAYYLDCEPLYYYLQRGGSTMHTPDFARITRERIAAGAAIQKYYEAHDLASKYAQELAFVWSFHCFLLPVREMCAYGVPFADYAKQLRKNLIKYSKNPAKNPYFATLSKREQLMLRLFWHKQYWVAGALTKLKAFLKGVRR